jgi:hypothetical protein
MLLATYAGMFTSTTNCASVGMVIWCVTGIGRLGIQWISSGCLVLKSLQNGLVQNQLMLRQVLIT